MGKPSRAGGSLALSELKEMDISESTNSLGPSSTAGTQGTEVSSKSKNPLRLSRTSQSRYSAGVERRLLSPRILKQHSPPRTLQRLALGKAISLRSYRTSNENRLSPLPTQRALQANCHQFEIFPQAIRRQLRLLQNL